MKKHDYNQSTKLDPRPDQEPSSINPIPGQSARLRAKRQQHSDRYDELEDQEYEQDQEDDE